MGIFRVISPEKYIPNPKIYVYSIYSKEKFTKIENNLNQGFLKTPSGIFWWLVASHIFQPPEKKALQRHTWLLGGWVAGGWWLGCQGDWWLVAGVRLLVAVLLSTTSTHRNKGLRYFLHRPREIK